MNEGLTKLRKDVPEPVDNEHSVLEAETESKLEEGMGRREERRDKWLKGGEVPDACFPVTWSQTPMSCLCREQSRSTNTDGHKTPPFMHSCRAISAYITQNH